MFGGKFNGTKKHVVWALSEEENPGFVALYLDNEECPFVSRLLLALW